MPRRIMTFTGTMLKNLFSKPVTKNYPAEPAVYPERSRGHIDIRIDECISCGMCVRSCPTGTLSVDKKAGTWTINRFDCIACGYCASKCPKKCLKLIPGYQKPGRSKAAVTYRKSEEVMEAERQKAAEMAARKAAALKAANEKKAAAAPAPAAKAAAPAPAENAAAPAPAAKAAVPAQTVSAAPANAAPAAAVPEEKQ